MSESVPPEKPEFRLSREKALLASKIKSHISSPEGSLLSRRLNWKNDVGRQTCSSRAFFIAKMCQFILGEKSFLKVIQSPRLLNLIKLGEYTVTQFYLENHINDTKYKIKERENLQKNLQEQKWLLKRIFPYGEPTPPFSNGNLLRSRLGYLFHLYRKGIDLDQKYLSFSNLYSNIGTSGKLDHKSFEFIDPQAFLDILLTYPRRNWEFSKIIYPYSDYFNLYLCRSFLINGVFFQVFTQLVIDIFGKPNSNYSSLIMFARIYGIAQQLVNDNTDFVPVDELKSHPRYKNHSKLEEDTFSDSRRKLITLPLIWYFIELSPDNWIKEFFENPRMDEEFLMNPYNQWKLLGHLKYSEALGKSMGLLTTLAKFVEEKIDFDRFPGLREEAKIMISIVRNNKFYAFYKALEANLEL